MKDRRSPIPGRRSRVGAIHESPLLYEAFPGGNPRFAFAARNLVTLTFLLFLASCGRPPGIYHTVHEGENLYRIAMAYGIDRKKIVEANDLRDPSKLSAGQKLYIPGARRLREVPLKKGKNPTARAAGRSSPKGKGGLARPPSRSAPPPLELPGLGFIWPVKGGKKKISSAFGPRGGRLHDGIDIRSPTGAAILAAEDGKVIYSGNGIRGYGNMVIIKHVGRVATVYAHNDANLVRRGEIVEKGQIIARVGRTGRATGPHLHFEIRNGKRPLDPRRYLP